MFNRIIQNEPRVKYSTVLDLHINLYPHKKNKYKNLDKLKYFKIN